MKKALLASVVTLLIGWVVADLFYHIQALGSVTAIAVMGGFIIYYGEQKGK